MERKNETYECAEARLLVKTYEGLRQILMARELEEDKKAFEKM
jgi:hypothetical protein